MPMVPDRAVCLRRHEFSETSQILTLFARKYGLVRVIARGSHRTTKAGASRFDGGVDLLDEADALFTDAAERDLNTLAEWRIVDGHRPLRGRSRSLHLALYLAELTSNLFEVHDPHPSLYDRFVRTLDDLGGPGLEEAALAFALDALSESGFLPSFDRCVSCDRPVGGGDRVAFFSPSRGGAVCRDCEGVVPDRVQVDPRLLGLAQMLLRLPRSNGSAQRLPRLTRHQTDPLHALLIPHVEHSTGRPMRLRRYVLPRGR